jgi:hypothetical protein
MKKSKISSFLSLGIVSLLVLTGCQDPETSQLENSSQETGNFALFHVLFSKNIVIFKGLVYNT